MKDILTNKRTTVFKSRLNRESIYYTALFCIGAIVAVVLRYIGKAKANKGLMTYASVLIPVFIVAALVAVRFAITSRNPIYAKENKLVVKSYFITRRYNVAEIEKLTVAQNGSNGLTYVNITYRYKTANYIFKSITKEEVAHLRRVASK